MKNIILIGMPGCGKSTVGVILAKMLGLDFIDTDIVIQSREGMRLAEILQSGGVSALLAAEERALLSLRPHGCVIASGGSAVLSLRGMEYLKTQGITCYLEYSRAALAARLGDFEERGIAAEKGETLADIFALREPLYKKYADFTVRPSGSATDTAVLLRRALGEM